MIGFVAESLLLDGCCVRLQYSIYSVYSTMRHVNIRSADPCLLSVGSRHIMFQRDMLGGTLGIVY